MRVSGVRFGEARVAHKLRSTGSRQMSQDPHQIVLSQSAAVEKAAEVIGSLGIGCSCEGAKRVQYEKLRHANEALPFVQHVRLQRFLRIANGRDGIFPRESADDPTNAPDHVQVL